MDVKMDNVNFDSTNSIFDNLNLHAKPMDSSTKNAMDTKRVHRRNGEEEQKGTDSIQQNSSSVQGRQQYFQKSRSTSKTNNIEGEWSLDRYSNPIRRSLLLVHDQSKLPKEEKNKGKSQETAEITFSAPRPNKDKKRIKKRTRENRKKYLR
ncbi:20651_t:CDS:2 [Funneliformis geosporum]|nr:20651_t:CDS:2 [Funneliformis geosporum]